MKITNYGIYSTGDNASNQIVNNAGADCGMNWNAVQEELQLLAQRVERDYESIGRFLAEANAAAAQKDPSKLTAAARKLGGLGADFFKQLSLTVLADLVKQSLL